MTEHKQNFGRV